MELKKFNYISREGVGSGRRPREEAQERDWEEEMPLDSFPLLQLNFSIFV
jgi:hypothetical protein